MTVLPKKKVSRLHPSLKTARPTPVLVDPNKRFVYVVPYKRSSKAARALNILFREKDQPNIGSRLTVIDVINWGHGGSDVVKLYEGQGHGNSVRVLNKTKSVNLVRDKLRFFKAMKATSDGPRIPEFTEKLEEAKTWIDKGEIIFGRMKTGSCGQDIVQFSEDPGRFAQSELWTKYKKKKAEFRVHIFRVGSEFRIVDVQQKTLRTNDPVTNEPINPEKVNFMIRNHKNGFIFQRYNISVPQDVKVQAIKALVASGLDFGAVDIVWNESEGKAYVLEVNSAPGLEGTTLDNYVSTFKEILSKPI